MDSPLPPTQHGRRMAPPPGGQCEARLEPLRFLHHLSGLLWILGSSRTAWAADSASRPSVRRRLVGLPPQVSEALLHPWADRPLDPVVAWLAQQLRVLLGCDTPVACVYMVVSQRCTYIGYTGQASAAQGRSNLGLPSVRGWQHVRDCMSGRRGTAGHRTAMFNRDPPGTLAWFLVACGSARTMMALERTLIKMYAPLANQTFARHIAQAGGAQRPTTPLVDSLVAAPLPVFVLPMHPCVLLLPFLVPSMSYLVGMKNSWLMKPGSGHGAHRSESGNPSSAPPTRAERSPCRSSPSGRWTSSRRRDGTS